MNLIMNRPSRVVYGYFAISIVVFSINVSAVEFLYDSSVPSIRFAVEEIKRAINPVQGETLSGRVIEISIAENESALDKGFQWISTSQSVRIIGSSSREAMYGGLEVAEQLRLGKSPFAPKNEAHEPYIERRGIKFNIPLDARTPSFDDSGDAAQKNISEMWSLDFWTDFLDQLARDRYNMLSLWNPHPFPSMIRSETYPDAALDNVCVTTLVPNGRENEWGEPQLVSANVISHLKVVKRLTIEEKIRFWQTVLQHAENRGIDVYFINWNICPNSVAKPVLPYYRTYDNAITTDEAPGKYGVTHEIDNPATIRYMRDAVKTFLLTYPTVKGIGVTSGEHMPISSERDREKWMWDVYAEGILDAKRRQPNRRVDFIHRVWNTNLENIMTRWQAYSDSFTLGFKYAKARLYSSPNIPFADEIVATMRDQGLKAWWNLRNDDLYVHRWGDPDYVRAFLQNIERDVTAGYHIGSDGYVWGREFVSRDTENPRELEISKHWYAFMLWGRLGYDPTLGGEFFVERLAARFPDTDPKQLYKTWRTASQIVPLVNQFYWRDWDHMWSVENSNSHKEGFHGVEAFCENRTMQGSGLVNVRDYVKAVVRSESPRGKGPIKVAAEIDALARASINGADHIAGKANKLEATVADIRGMAWLGHYYAAKIRAAVALSLFRQSGELKDHEEAIKEIQSAYEACTQYVDHSQARYHSQMLARSGLFDWAAMLTSARKDVAIVREARFPGL